MGNAIARAAGYHVPFLNVELLSQLLRMASMFSMLDVHVAARRREDGLDVAGEVRLRPALSTEWIDEDFYSLVSLRRAVCAV